MVTNKVNYENYSKMSFFELVFINQHLIVADFKSIEIFTQDIFVIIDCKYRR